MNTAQPLPALSYLTATQKNALSKGNLESLADLLLVSPQDLGRRCRISPLEARSILDSVCQTNAPQIRALSDISDQDQCCTTGETHLDLALGGGFRTGMVWEIFGEGGAGKTQMALQLSLLVQLPVDLGGLSGSACYITINSALQTHRLLQIIDAHPLLSHDICSLNDIETISSPTIPLLLTILSKKLPDLISMRDKDPQSKPIRLLVLDALADLFHASDKTTTGTLIERSQNIADISVLLHALAAAHNIAVLVLNNATDVFHSGEQDDGSSTGNLHYRHQSRWFGGADTVPGEANKEANLGLVWANQVNARVMMSRTGRRRYIDEKTHNKRRKVDNGDSNKPIDANIHLADSEGTLIRRLSVVFSSVFPPCSLDYVVTAAGISVLPDDGAMSLPESDFHVKNLPNDVIPASTMPPSQLSQLAPLDVGIAEQTTQSELAQARDEDEEDWENYWNVDAIPDELYNSLETDGLDPSE